DPLADRGRPCQELHRLKSRERPEHLLDDPGALEAEGLRALEEAPHLGPIESAGRPRLRNTHRQPHPRHVSPRNSGSGPEFEIAPTSHSSWPDPEFVPGGIWSSSPLLPQMRQGQLERQPRPDIAYVAR